jgi:hypothetical protein
MNPKQTLESQLMPNWLGPFHQSADKPWARTWQEEWAYSRKFSPNKPLALDYGDPYGRPTFIPLRRAGQV